jgi:DNA polymerase III delta prime subunit
MKTQQHPIDIPLRVFLSYAHVDETLRASLETHLSYLQREGRIALWHDRQVVPGMDWAQEIDEALSTASLILLLISPDFVASDYCYGIEMTRVLELHRAGTALVVPVIVRPVDWSHLPFVSLQSLPRNMLPVTSWSNQDEAWLDIAQGIRRTIDHIRRSTTPQATLSLQDQTNRKHLIHFVRSIWIEGMLDHSLYQSLLITLDLHEQPGAFLNSFHLEVQETDVPAHPLPPDTPLIKVYDDAMGELLILGEPGAGKTTLLLNLARTLLQRAERKEVALLPVIFHLSSWANKCQPLAKWLIGELHEKYFVPWKVGELWVTNGLVLPLLDGLDEVKSDARSDCVEAINTYHKNYADIPIVLSCRKQAYLNLPVRVQIQKAVIVQSLTPQQVNAYFQAAQGKLEYIQRLTQQDETLRELVTTPLILSVLILAYQNVNADEIILKGSGEKQQHQIFAAYASRMLNRRGKVRMGTPKQMESRLIFLARQMKRQNQTVFSLEDMQPDWCSTSLFRWAYEGLAIRFPGFLIGICVSTAVMLFLSIEANFNVVFGLVGGMIGVILSGRNVEKRWTVGKQEKWIKRCFSFIWEPLISGIVLGFAVVALIIAGIIEFPGYYDWFQGGLSYAASGIFLSLILKATYRRQQETFPDKLEKSTWFHRFKNEHIRNGLLIGGIFGICNGFLDGWTTMTYTKPYFDLSTALFTGLRDGVLYGVIGIFLSIILARNIRSIQPAEVVRWVWSNLFNRRHIRNTLLVGGLIFLSGIVEFMYQEVDYWSGGISSGGLSTLGSSIVNIFSVGLGYWLLVGLLQGVSSSTIDAQRRTIPNQGIRRSLRNGLWIALISCLVTTVIFTVEQQLSSWFLWGEDAYGPVIALTYGLSVGLTIGLLAGLLTGMLAYLQHHILRLLLWLAGSISWRYPQFLDEAAERLLLCKVGGGYMFIHRLLLEYFASLDTAAIPNAKRTKMNYNDKSHI